MSTTMTLTMAPATTETTCCPNCGVGLPQEHIDVGLAAQRQIEDLQAQVKLLTQKATAAVDRWADYEDELQTLREELQKPQALVATEIARAVTPPSGYIPMSNRLSSFLISRKSTTNLHTPPTPTVASPSERDLQAKLDKEQKLRQQAEGKLDDATGELEELSVQLFTQANEMVATERKARAKLEERVEVLERRDVEKRKRLERLEGAMGRIDRVRGLLGNTAKV